MKELFDFKMNPVQAVAHKCWYIASTELVQKLFDGSISQDVVQGVLESIPELGPILPSETTQREHVASAVFEALQQRKKVLDQLPAFIKQAVPQHDEPGLQAHQASEFMRQIRQQFEDSLLPLFEVMLTGDIAVFKEHLAEASGDASMRQQIPCERFFEKIIKIVGSEEGKTEKLAFLERFRQLLAEDMPVDSDAMLSHLKEVVWNLNNFSGKVFTPQDKVKIIEAFEEDVEYYPALSALYEQFDGDVDKLISVVFSAQTASALLNRELGQSTRPEDFHPPRNDD